MTFLLCSLMLIATRACPRRPLEIARDGVLQATEDLSEMIDKNRIDPLPNIFVEPKISSTD